MKICRENLEALRALVGAGDVQQGQPQVLVRYDGCPEVAIPTPEGIRWAREGDDLLPSASGGFLVGVVHQITHEDVADIVAAHKEKTEWPKEPQPLQVPPQPEAQPKPATPAKAPRKPKR